MHKADKEVDKIFDHKWSDIFCLANQMRKGNIYVGNKAVKNDAEEMSMSKEAKQNVCAEHYEKLLNIELEWGPEHQSNEPLLKGPPIPMT